jgi:lipopolysaccharide heptosyltransferase II
VPGARELIDRGADQDFAAQQTLKRAKALQPVGNGDHDFGGRRISPQPIVVLQPGARYWFKAWPPERFAELADQLTSQYGCQMLIGGSNQDIDLAQQIRQMAKSQPIIMAGRTTIKQFAAIAKKSALFVGSDSGAMHIASAVGTPVVALFGPSNPREWGPRGGPVEVLYKEIDCRSCFHPTCMRGEENCMKLIAVHEVVAAAQRLLQAGKPN